MPISKIEKQEIEDKKLGKVLIDSDTKELVSRDEVFSVLDNLTS